MSEDSRGTEGHDRSRPGHPSPLDVLGRAQYSGPDWWSRLWDGPQLWGSCEHSYLRYGIWRVRITMYPPGASTTDRRRIRVWRGWSMWSITAWLLGTVVVQSCGLSAVVALVVSFAVAVLIGLACRHCVGPLRHQVKTVAVLTMSGCTDHTVLDRRDKLVRMAETMIDADRALKGGIIDPVAHELVWQRMYNEIGSLQGALVK